MQPLDLLWLLLPVAAASGWYLARRGELRGDEERRRSEWRSDYFQGINYLLNEQPDKAIEVFIRVLEVGADTIETHMALGNLYRRRGEVDRAIRIHQNLIARPELAEQQRLEALLELAQDYLGAGLLDRAEDLFQELAETPTLRVQALRQLIDIYEQEKDWTAAMATARRLEAATGNQLAGVLAQYQCEQAGERVAEGDFEGALEFTARALATDPGCVRASLLEGDIHAERGELDRAVPAYLRVEDQDPEYLPESIDRLYACYRAGAGPADLEPYLEDLTQRHRGATATLALADLKQTTAGPRAAIEFVASELRQHMSVRGIDRLLELELEQARGEQAARLSIIKDLTGELVSSRPVYRCAHCGFPARALHWKCPSCKHWNSVKPIQGLEGE